MLGGFSDGYAGELVHSDTEYSYEDYVAQSNVKNYIISIDPKGILGYNSCYIEKKNRPKAYIIEALTELASNDYISYLRSIGISYVFTGKEQINFTVLLEKLYKLFSIKRILAAGGGLTNWSLAQENLIDELSIVIAPTADGNTTSATIFEKSDFLPERKPAEFKLKNIKQIDNAVHLLYEAKR